MKAYVDAGNDSRDPDYHNLKQGLPVQQRKAQALHRDAGVPEGPCVIRELQQFQAALPGYQLKVVSIDPPHIDSSKRVNIMTGDIHSKVSSRNPTSATIVIEGTITTTLNIIPATANGAPLANAKNCIDFIAAKQPLGPGNFPTPRSICRLCDREFFLEDCYASHLMRRSLKIRSVCDTHKKCPDCRHVYELDSKVRRGATLRQADTHKCGWVECTICENKVELATHRCYIQRLPENENDPKLKRVKMQNVVCRPYIPDEKEEGYAWVERKPPLQVYCDYVASTDAERNQTPVLLCLEDDESDDTHFFYGPDCTADMFDHLESIAVDMDGADRDVIVIFHNLKGYDGMFILQHWYATHREVTDQITVGTKILSLKSDRLTFKDSLCFLSFPLATSPPPSGSRNCARDYSHTNSTPKKISITKDPCHPKTCTILMACRPKRKPNSTVATKRRSMPITTLSCNERCRFTANPISNSSRPDVKFREEFRQHANFDPIEKCVTIASARNRL